MTLDARYHPEAAAELRAGVAWYESRAAGLGQRFEDSVDEVLDSVLEWPEAGVVWPGWASIPVARSRRVAGFPFRLAYLIDDVEIVVLALAHDKRPPGYWRDRASG